MHKKKDEEAAMARRRKGSREQKQWRRRLRRDRDWCTRLRPQLEQLIKGGHATVLLRYHSAVRTGLSLLCALIGGPHRSLLANIF
jgi:hypothetical protein